MEPSSVDRWIAGYVKAWSTNDPADIEALFTEDAAYRTAPWREPWEGHAAIVEGWQKVGDDPGDWTFEHEVLAVDGDLAFVQGRTWYEGEQKRYANLWVIRLTEDGRATAFTEWWMEER